MPERRGGSGRPMGGPGGGTPSMGRRINGGANAPLAGSGRGPVGGYNRPGVPRTPVGIPHANMAPPPRGHVGRGTSGSVLGSILTAGVGYLIGKNVSADDENTSTVAGQNVEEEASASSTAATSTTDTQTNLPAQCPHCGAPVSSSVCEYCRCNVI